MCPYYCGFNMLAKENGHTKNHIINVIGHRPLEK